VSLGGLQTKKGEHGRKVRPDLPTYSPRSIIEMIAYCRVERETLAIYQHVALDGQLEERYQKAMREVEI
jgi:hypothetical protein